MNEFSSFLRNEKGAVTIEFVTMVPFFVMLLVFFTDASIVYLTHSEMWSVARDTVRRMSTEELTTPAQARDYAATRLFLGQRAYVIDPIFDAERRVRIAVGLDDAAIFGFFLKPVLGKALVVDVTMRREPLP